MGRLFHLFCLFIILGWLSSSAALAASGSDPLLDSPGKRVVPISVLPQWQRILQSHTYSNPQSTGYKEWQEFIISIQDQPKLRQMLKVNQWFQKYSYKLDKNIFGQEDYWASPVEFFQRGGDCEDFAIVKYMTLRQLGFSTNDMKIAMVYDVYSGTDHSFLIVNYNGSEFVMDNREKVTVSRYLKNRYKMHYAFNEDAVWTYNKPVMASRARSPDSAILPGNR